MNYEESKGVKLSQPAIGAHLVSDLENSLAFFAKKEERIGTSRLKLDPINSNTTNGKARKQTKAGT